MPYPELLPWYQRHKREFPFRGTRDPYAVWVSEIMLQQTRTETVTGYYERFLVRFPNVSALASAEEQEVLKYWEGLGYYSRARNLHRTAQLIMEKYDGTFPKTYKELRALPGIGDYTAAAISSIAYQLPYPAVDGNLIRVISRVHGIREDADIPSVRGKILSIAQQNIDTVTPGDWNQALMDIGATICVPGTPDCSRCPLSGCCDANAEGDADLLPIRTAAKPPKPIDVAVGLVTCANHILVCRRDAALLRGLWVFLLNEGDSSPAAFEKLLPARYLSSGPRFLSEARHVFTHRIWNMRIYHLECIPGVPAQDGIWTDMNGLSSLPMPTAMKAARSEAVRLLSSEV